VFILFCVFLVLAGIAGAVAGTARKTPPPGRSDAKWKARRPPARAATVVLALAAAGCLFVSMVTVVGSREVGIVTSFGKYQSTQGPGWHFNAPWSDVERFSTRVQSLKREGTKVTLLADSATSEQAEARSLAVPGGSGTVRATVRWAIADSKKAEALWRGYKDFATVQHNLVAPEADTSVQEVFGGQTATAARDGKNRRVLGQQVAANLQRSLDSEGIRVLSVIVTDVDLDADTEARLKSLAASSARLVQQQIDTKVAEEQARTNAARTGKRSIEQAQRDRCLDILADAVAHKAELPATLNCGLGQNSTPTTVSVR
jgi:regulator of protease activity HflC (stomatin/prohibitin superfamily)